MAKRPKVTHTQRLVMTAMMMAIIMVLTYMVRIPAVATRGYVHLGDAAIFLGVLILGRHYGAIAAGFGSAIADVLGGYVYFAPITFFVKAIMAWVLGLFLQRVMTHERSAKANYAIVAVGMVIAGAIMVVGYYAAEAVMYGNIYVPLTEVPLNIAQFVAAMALSLPLGISLSKTPFGRYCVIDLAKSSLGSETTNSSPGI